MKVSPQMQLIFAECEIINESGDVKSLEELTLSDLQEIWSELDSDEDKRLENSSEFMEIALSCANLSTTLLDSLKILEFAVSTVSGEFENPNLIKGIHEIVTRVRSLVDISTQEKEYLFKVFTEDEDNWFNPVIGTVMVLVWDLSRDAIDDCVIRYASLRSHDVLEIYAWENNEQNDLSHWMPLLVFTVLNSSGSENILNVTRKTFNTTSVMPFWMLICAVLGYLLPESKTRELYEEDTIDWFPESYWKELFEVLRDSVKADQRVLDRLIKLFISDADDWMWTTHYVKDKEDVYDFLAVHFSEVASPFPGLQFLIETRQSRTFHSAVALLRNEQADEEKALELLLQLSSEGHIESTYELLLRYLYQSDFDMATKVLNQDEIDATHPTIIYLKALLLMEQGKFDIGAFARAAEAGSAMAAFRLVEHFLPTDREEAKNWLAKAKRIGHKEFEHYQNKFEFSPRRKSFIIISGTDDSHTYKEVRVYSNDDHTLIEKFNDEKEAINFCLEKKQGIENASFEFREVGDDWPDESELAFDDPFNLSCRVTPKKDEIVIWTNDELLWRGTTHEMSEAIEYLIENTDEWWELVYCDYERFEAEDTDEVEAEHLPVISELPFGSDVEKTLHSATSSITGADILEKLSSHNDLEIRCAVAWNNNTSFISLHNLAKDITEEVRFCVASNSSANLDTLLSLSIDESEFVREQAKFKIYELAGKPNTSPETLAMLAKDVDAYVRSSVAENPNTSPETLAMLAKDIEWGVRSSVAKNPNASPDLSRILSKDEDGLVRRSVAENPNTSPETLAMLAKDIEWGVRASVAKNPNASPDLLRILAKEDDEDSVHTYVAENPNTSPKTLAMLAEDDDAYVRRSVAENPNTSPETLAMLAEDDEDSVRVSVAENPNTSPETLAMLAEDDEDSVRVSVAENPNTSPETLAMLAEDDEDSVRVSVAENPNTSPETLDWLAEVYEYGLVRFYVAKNPNASPETLAMLAEDDDAYVRRSVAENPNTSLES
jgi:3-methyladenine DNA glycosylase AlkC